MSATLSGVKDILTVLCRCWLTAQAAVEVLATLLGLGPAFAGARDAIGRTLFRHPARGSISNEKHGAGLPEQDDR